MIDNSNGTRIPLVAIKGFNIKGYWVTMAALGGGGEALVPEYQSVHFLALLVQFPV